MIRSLLAALMTLYFLPSVATADAADAPPATPEWQELVTVATPPGSVAARYQALLTAQLQADAELYGKQAWLKQFLASAEFRFGPATFSDTDTHSPVEWHFQSPGDARWPTRAIRRQFQAGTPYRVQVEVHCDDTAKACADFVEQARRMPAPRPPFPTSATADLQAWDQSTRAWREIVLREACEPGARQMPAPRYPSSALRQGVTGKVILILLANPCGEVRDATIEVSSRSRDLDRAALDVARRWRVNMPADVPPGTGAIMRVPITFDEGDGQPAAAPPPSAATSP
jgi:TonB family protein